MSKEKVKDPVVPPFAKSISPGSNFYGFVNANWLRRVRMPPYESSYGVSEEIEDSISVQLTKLLEDARAEVQSVADKELRPDIRLLGTLYHSVLDARTQDISLKFVRNLVANLRCIRSLDDVAVHLAEFVRYQIPSILTVFTAPEEQHSKFIRLYMTLGSLGLPDTSYYTLEVPARTRVLEAYSKMLHILESQFDAQHLGLFVGIERILAEAMEECRGDQQELLKGSELRSRYGGFPWERFSEAAFGTTSSEFESFLFCIDSPKWLKYFNKWAKTWSMENWKALLAGQAILYFLPLLPPPFDELHFELFGKRILGESDKTPQNVLGLKICKKWLMNPLGNLYVDSYVPKDLKKNVSLIAKEIVNAAQHRLHQVAWLHPETRKRAAKKLAGVHIEIAYPDTYVKTPDVVLHPEQFIENVCRLAEADFEENLKHVNKLLRPERWEEGVFEVNAYYYNEGNRLYLPSGILQYPFYSTDASDGWNFGGIGASLGHELTHAFDVDGKMYDENGNKVPWWTTSDLRNYTRVTKPMITLYNKTKYINQSINGTLTLSENIADLGGVAIALAALKARLAKRGLSKEETIQEVCDFFVSYAVSWRTKEKKQKAYQSIFTDVHAPPIIRVNNIVRQFDDFYECFNVQPGQTLYTAPEDRIRIF